MWEISAQGLGNDVVASEQDAFLRRGKFHIRDGHIDLHGHFGREADLEDRDGSRLPVLGRGEVHLDVFSFKRTAAGFDGGNAFVVGRNRDREFILLLFVAIASL